MRIIADERGLTVNDIALACAIAPDRMGAILGPECVLRESEREALDAFLAMHETSE